MRHSASEEVWEGVGESDGRFSANGLLGIGKYRAVLKVDADKAIAAIPREQEGRDVSVGGVDFSRRSDPSNLFVKVSPVGISADETARIVDRVLRTFSANRQIEVRPVDTLADVPPNVEARHQREHGDGHTDTQGVHDGDVIYVVGGNHNSTADAARLPEEADDDAERHDAGPYAQRGRVRAVHGAGRGPAQGGQPTRCSTCDFGSLANDRGFVLTVQSSPPARMAPSRSGGAGSGLPSPCHGTSPT